MGAGRKVSVSLRVNAMKKIGIMAGVGIRRRAGLSCGGSAGVAGSREGMGHLPTLLIPLGRLWELWEQHISDHAQPSASSAWGLKSSHLRPLHSSFQLWL